MRIIIFKTSFSKHNNGFFFLSVFQNVSTFSPNYLDFVAKVTGKDDGIPIYTVAN